ncbi:chemotaxis protein CheC [Evansella vedderi]|uniref:Chemotaxis protein CheC n=1 Tax=Evansella vedderi TaxID=38282 RepID=A0ABT9ZU56_9BACI|nr:chemotaxis protein CheC [Evansella vedderi]MDQ0253690.1 chemotaxis protein CheC [Evansella vedderi]
MSYLKGMEPKYLDVLQEVGNIGAGHAATAMSKLLNKGIDMKVPAVKVVPFKEMNDSVGDEEGVVAAIYFRIQGEASGHMFFMIQAEEASKLIQQIVGDPMIDFTLPTVNEMALSALSEVGNILAGSYLSAFSDFTGLHLQPTPPALAIDMPMAILSYGLMEFSEAGDVAILINTEINEKMENDVMGSKGHFFLLPDPDSLEQIFTSLGVKVNE